MTAPVPPDANGLRERLALLCERWESDGPLAPEAWQILDAVRELFAASEAAPTAGEEEAPTFLYHWSPARNRSSIDRHGLRPGSASNLVPQWNPPHVCYGETPSAALALTLLDDRLDLWMVRTDGHHFALSNEGFEWRTAEALPAWYVASRASRDSATDMTASEQAEADEVVAYLHEESIANGEDDD